MPRIEFIHDKITKWYETNANGNGTSTFDLCKHCFKEGMSANELNLTNKTLFLLMQPHSITGVSELILTLTNTIVLNVIEN